MKKVFLLMLVVVFWSTCFGAFTNSIASRPNADWWTGQTANKDKAWAWAKEVETLLGGTDGTTGFNNILYNPTTEPTSTTGRLYYDLAGNVFKYYNSSEWVTMEAGIFTISLDGAYDVGQTITVEHGTVTLTAPDAANNDVLALVQVDAAGTSVLTLTSAATGALIEFTSNGSGGDMKGTGNTWSISKAGAFVIDGSITLSTADVLFDSTSAGVDIQFDEGSQLLHFLDAGAGSAILGFGGSADGAADITFIYDGAGNDLDIAFDDKEIAFGSDGAGGDIFIYTEAGSSYFKFAEATDDLQLVAVQIILDDNSDLVIGGDTEWVIDNSAETLRIIPSDATNDFAIELGNATYTSDLKIFGITTSTVEFDASADLVTFDAYDAKFGDGDILYFGDAPDISIAFDGGGGDLNILGAGLEVSFGVSGGGMDVVMHGTTASQTVWWDASGDEWFFGADAEGVDVTWYGDTAGSDMIWDETANTNGALIFDAADIEMGDTDFIEFGDTSDATIQWNASLLKIEAVTTVAGNAIQIETSDGGIHLNADGGTNGNIDIDAASVLTLTGAGGVVMELGTGASTWQGNLLPATVVKQTLTTGAVTSADCGFVNQISADAQTITLPATVTGLAYTFMCIAVDGSALLTIELDGADKFVGAGFATDDGEAMTLPLATQNYGDYIKVIAHTDGWIITEVVGTWAEATP